MAEQTLLIIDPNTQNLNVMEVQLRKYDYEVVSTSNIARAEQMIEVSPPDLIICSYQLDDGQNAAQFCQRLKEADSTRNLPFLAIVDQKQQRVTCLNEGADDVLVRPLYMAELRDRAEILIQRQRRLTLEQGAERFFGRLEEMGLLDLMQVIEVSKRSGKLVIEHQIQRAEIWFDSGIAHDAKLGSLSGEDAIYRLLTWEFGQYEFDFQASPRPNTIRRSLEDLRAQGLKYIDQWHKMSEQLPSLETIFRRDPNAIQDRFEPLDAVLKSLIDVFDGQMSALEVINQAPLSDLEALQALTQLYFEGLIYEVDEASPLSQVSEAVFIDAVPPAPEFEPQETPEVVPEVVPELDITNSLMAELAQDPIDFHLHAKETPPPSLNFTDTQLPPSIDQEYDFTPPPLTDVNVTPEIPEEGQDLLAELYAAREEEPEFNLENAPPPVPDSLPDESNIEAVDETYSTLFGVGGNFTYDDDESSFFNQSDADFENTFGQEEHDHSMGAGTKSFLLIALIFAAAMTGYFLYDDVKALRVTQKISPDWMDVELSGRKLNPDEMSPAEGGWELELINRAQATMPTVEDSKLNQETQESKKPTNASQAQPRTQQAKRSGGKSFSQLMKSAIQLKKSEKFQQSFDLVEQALELKPSAPDAQLLAAVCLSELGKDRTALGHLQQLLQSNPEYGNKSFGAGYGPGVVYNLIALTFNNLGDKQSALKHYETYLRKYPSGMWSSEIKSIVARLKR